MKKSFKNRLALIAVLCAVATAMTACSNGGSKEITMSDIENQMNKLNSATASQATEDNEESSETVETIDPFKDLKVTFEGIIPQATMNMSGENSYVEYTESQESGFKNGDKVTVEAKVKQGFEDKYVLSETKKEYTVSDLDSYIFKMADISDEAMNKMQNKAEAIIDEKYSDFNGWFKMSSKKLLGQYFLTLRDDASSWNASNGMFWVYEIKGVDADDSTKKETFYTYVEIDNILQESNGTYSVKTEEAELCGNEITLDNFWVDGYKTLDDLRIACVTEFKANYNAETNIDDGSTPKAESKAN